jgi:hypothetical protein
VLGSDPVLDAPIDVIERELRRVQLALARPRLLSKPFLLANDAHYRMLGATLL